MAKNQTNKNSKGVYGKMKNAFSISPFRSIRHNSHHPQTNNTPSPLVQTTDNPVRAYVSRSKPGELIPTESKGASLLNEEEDRAKPHAVIQKHLTVASILSTGHAATKEAKTTQMAEITEQQGNAMSKNEHANLAQDGQLKPRVDRAPGTKFVISNGYVTKSELDQIDDRCSEYITRVRNSMRTGSEPVSGSTATTVTSGTRLTRQDSFDDKVSSFLNRARIKIRTTSNVGDTKNSPFKGRGNDNF